MVNEQLKWVKIEVQSIIDCIGKKQDVEANHKISHLRETLNEILDSTTNEAIIREISKYQVLLDYLVLKKLNRNNLN